jgi:hypothetical protein
MAACLCTHLNWRPLATLLQSFQERLDHGVKKELLPLARLGSRDFPPHRARALYSAGFTTPLLLARAPVAAVAAALERATAFESSAVQRSTVSSASNSKSKKAAAQRLAERVVYCARAEVQRQAAVLATGSMQ